MAGKARTPGWHVQRALDAIGGAFIHLTYAASIAEKKHGSVKWAKRVRNVMVELYRVGGKADRL